MRLPDRTQVAATVLLAWTFLLAPTALPAQRAPDRSLLPDNALAAIEIADPAAAVQAVLAQLGPVPADLPEATRGRISLGLLGLTAALGSTPERWARRLAGGGAVLGWVPHDGAPVAVAITRPDDPAAAGAWCRRVLGEGHHELVGDHLLLAGTPAVLPKLGRSLERGQGRLAGVAIGTARVGTGQIGTEEVGTAPGLVQAVVDLEAVRSLLGRHWPSPRHLEPGARLLLAPFATAFDQAKWLRINLVARDGVHVRLVADATARGGDGGGLLVDAPRPLPKVSADVAVALRLERSLHGLFAAPAQFLDDDGVLGLQEFLSIADGLDGPTTSFVEHGLGGLGEPIDLLVFGVPALDPDEPRAPLLLPQFALVTSVPGERVEAMFTRMVRLFATIANAERQQQGKRAYLVRARRSDDGGRGIVAETRTWAGTGKPPFEQHLTPTLWFARGHVALASTEQAAIAAIDAACGGVGRGRRGDHLLVHGRALAEALRANHRVLVMSRVLDEGEPPDRADDFVRGLEAIAAAIGTLELSSTSADRRTEVTLVLRRAAGERR
jgi:hypothetical protein